MTFKSLTGSPLIGNPLTATVTAASPTGTLSFQRIKLQVFALIDGIETALTAIEMSSPASKGEDITIDISSALRAVADKYVYTPNPVTYPRIKFQLKGWDEYMINGEVHQSTATYFPSSSSFYYGLQGAFTDLERLQSNGSKKAFDFCRKPTDSPQIVCVGETFAYTNTYFVQGNNSFDGYTMADLPYGPTSIIQDILSEGSQQIGDVQIYALPADTSGNRYEFRFINGLGVLDSIAVNSLRESEMNVTSSFQTISRKESFSSFSRGINRKQNDYETWKLSSGPLDEKWMQWFMHEFLMAEHVWLNLKNHSSAVSQDTWLRCHIITDESVAGVNKLSDNTYEVNFSVRLDINGSL